MNKILAICMDEPAIFVNPSNAATIATTKNITAQLNIQSFLLSSDYTILSETLTEISLNKWLISDHLKLKRFACNQDFLLPN
jgi:hypothetical protein